MTCTAGRKLECVDDDHPSVRAGGDELVFEKLLATLRLLLKESSVPALRPQVQTFANFNSLRERTVTRRPVHDELEPANNKSSTIT